MGVCFLTGQGNHHLSDKPSYAYSGTVEEVTFSEESELWFREFKTSGMLTLNNRIRVDIFAYGGGGGANTAGGGGGYTAYKSDVILVPGSYSITIGEGGAGGSTPKDGSDTSAFGLIAEGGKGATTVNSNATGGSGGSGGGSPKSSSAVFQGGTQGKNGFGSHPGIGYSNSTTEISSHTALFEDSLLNRYYCSGGNGNSGSSTANENGDGTHVIGGGSGTNGKGGSAADNSGGGGGGGSSAANGGAGGSGAVWIRAHKD